MSIQIYKPIVYSEDGIVYKGIWSSLDTEKPKFTLSNNKKFEVNYVFVNYQIDDFYNLDTKKNITIKLNVDSNSNNIEIIPQIMGMNGKLYGFSSIQKYQSKNNIIFDWNYETSENIFFLIYKNNVFISSTYDTQFEDNDIDLNIKNTYCLIGSDLQGNIANSKISPLVIYDPITNDEIVANNFLINTSNTKTPKVNINPKYKLLDKDKNEFAFIFIQNINF